MTAHVVTGENPIFPCFQSRASSPFSCNPSVRTPYRWKPTAMRSGHLPGYPCPRTARHGQGYISSHPSEPSSRVAGQQGLDSLSLAILSKESMVLCSWRRQLQGTSSICIVPSCSELNCKLGAPRALSEGQFKSIHPITRLYHPEQYH
jgi:hypothetical protein